MQVKMMCRRLVAIATPARILLVGWLLFLVYAYPGYLSADPVQQLGEARAGFYTDWHPPMMAFLWRLVEHVISGTFGMLVLQSVPFLIGLAAVLRQVLSPRKAAVVAVGVMLFPPVLTTMAVIWKDSQMAGYLVAGIACMLATRRRWQLVGCGFFWLATAMRYNALAATFPVMLALFEWRPGLPRVRRYAIALLAWVAVTWAAVSANKLITDRPSHVWCQAALHDITGILHFGPVHADASIERMLPGVLHVHDHIRVRVDKAYLTWSNYYLTFGDERLYDFPETDQQVATVARAWRRLILREPRAYLYHRYKVSLEILALTKNPVIAPVWDGMPDEAWSVHYDGVGITIRHSAWQRWWVNSLRAFGQTILFRAYLYFFLSMALLLLCRDSRLCFALLASGLCYEVTFFVAAVPDARYGHWMATCTVLVYVMTFIERYRAGRREIRR